MKALVISAATALVVIGLTPIAATAADDPFALPADQLKWQPSAPHLPKGAQSVVVSGDPTTGGEFVTRLRVPAGYRLAPHVHPNDENVTVISGTWHIAFGSTFDDTKGTALKAGGFARIAKGVQHYFWVTEDTVIQVHGIGPGGFNYANPADDPRK